MIEHLARLKHSPIHLLCIQSLFKGNIRDNRTPLGKLRFVPQSQVIFFSILSLWTLPKFSQFAALVCFTLGGILYCGLVNNICKFLLLTGEIVRKLQNSARLNFFEDFFFSNQLNTLQTILLVWLFTVKLNVKPENSSRCDN